MMRFISYLLLPWILMACLDKEENLTGRYTGTQIFGIGQIDSPFVLELRQNGDEFSGTVTPPFSNEPALIQNCTLEGSLLRFHRKEGEITFRYEARLNPEGTVVQGEFQPLGCSDPESGEPCQTDSGGSFTAEKH